MNEQQKELLQTALDEIDKWWAEGSSACDLVEFVENQIREALRDS
jgi:uncharacterized protein YoaH (UPF0181 family)